MSFSSQVKEDLSKLNNLVNKEQVKYELVGYLISNNTVCIKKNKIKFSTESEYNINRFSKLLNNINLLDYKIEIQGRAFVISFKYDNQLEELINYAIEDYNIKLVEFEEENLKALARGLFLGSGSINNPENKNHLEMNLSNYDNAEIMYDSLKKFDLKFKKMKSSKGYSLYLKDGEEISKFLAFIGANKAVMKFEGIRVQRDMNNKINRLVNCEAANLNKTMNAAIMQIEAIEYLKKVHKFDILDDNLKEIAQVRIENPDMSLAGLGGLLKNPIGKSGVNYRLKKIIEIANELR